MLSRWSFKFKLQICLGLLALTALLTAGYLSYQLNTGLKQSKMELLSRSVESIADKVDRNLFERYGDVQAFAMSEPARSGDRARIEKFMTDMMSAYAPIYDVMIVVDRKGAVVAVNDVDKSGKGLDSSQIKKLNYADADWFKEAVGGNVKPGSAHFTDLRVDEDTAAHANTDGRVMIFSAPIRDVKTGEILGVWSNRMSWTDVVEDIVVKESQKLKNEKIPTIAAYLVNQDATYLVHSNKKEVLKGRASGIDDFLKLNVDTWAHTLDTSDDIHAAAIETFSKAKGYSTYPGQKWTYILRAPKSDAALQLTQASSISGVFLIFAIAFFALMLANGASKSLESTIERLTSEATKVAGTAGEVTKLSEDLSVASVKQASALQQTAASIEQINAMIGRSNENSSRSLSVSGESAQIANRGKEAVQKMSIAIGEIDASNEAISTQIADSHRQIGEITRVIADIGDKTKVINEIVFQTKLLSFNASVEAARAGEHGKGFAVVAEEIGSLAQMSGNAAKEISEMLAQSIRTVEETVNQTSRRIETLVFESREKVRSGVAIAGECGTTLDEVVNNVAELNAMMAEIGIANQEQAQGVNEITKAMHQLDQTTDANAATSKHVSSYATSLSHDADQMNEIVIELSGVVSGSNGKAA